MLAIKSKYQSFVRHSFHLFGKGCMEIWSKKFPTIQWFDGLDHVNHTFSECISSWLTTLTPWPVTTPLTRTTSLLWQWPLWPPPPTTLTTLINQPDPTQNNNLQNLQKKCGQNDNLKKKSCQEKTCLNNAKKSVTTICKKKSCRRQCSKNCKNYNFLGYNHYIIRARYHHLFDWGLW